MSIDEAYKSFLAEEEVKAAAEKNAVLSTIGRRVEMVTPSPDTIPLLAFLKENVGAKNSMNHAGYGGNQRDYQDRQQRHSSISQQGAASGSTMQGGKNRRKKDRQQRRKEKYKNTGMSSHNHNSNTSSNHPICNSRDLVSIPSAAAAFPLSFRHQSIPPVYKRQSPINGAPLPSNSSFLSTLPNSAPQQSSNTCSAFKTNNKDQGTLLLPTPLPQPLLTTLVPLTSSKPLSPAAKPFLPAALQQPIMALAATNASSSIVQSTDNSTHKLSSAFQQDEKNAKATGKESTPVLPVDIHSAVPIEETMVQRAQRLAREAAARKIAKK
jgi:cytoskeletal protein RodZ